MNVCFGGCISLVQEALPNFWGDIPIFGGTAPIFGGIAPKFRGRDRYRALRATKLCHSPHELKFAPENQV